jgi:hypothetical protein
VEGEMTPEIEAGIKDADLTLEIGTATEEMTDPGIRTGNDDTPHHALALGIPDVVIVKISKSGGLGIGNEGRGLPPLIRREAAA